MRELSILVGIPSGGDWKPNFGMCLVNMVLHSQAPLRDGRVISRLSLQNTKGSILPKNRLEIVRRALAGRYTHVLFLDDDMTFPANLLHRLLSHGKSVIACNCPTKMLPSTSTARMKSDKHYGVAVDSNTMVGVSQVWRVGTGVMLLDTKVFRDVKQPWFPVEWNETTGEYVGEDWAFCTRLEEANIPIYVDHALSREIGHVGSYEFRHSDIPSNTTLEV